MTIRLPLGSSATEPHVPILASKDLKSRKRVIVLLGERSQDLGIFSYRVIGDKDINAGSAVDFCNAILNTPQVHAANGTIDEPPGIIITNPGQLLWYRGGNRAVTYREWANLPRTTAVHEPFKIDRHKNTVPENRNYEEHVNYIFDHVLPCMTSSQAKFEIIGLEYPGRIALQYLANNCKSIHLSSSKRLLIKHEGNHGNHVSPESASGLHNTHSASSRPMTVSRRISASSFVPGAVPTTSPPLPSKPRSLDRSIMVATSTRVVNLGTQRMCWLGRGGVCWTGSIWWRRVPSTQKASTPSWRTLVKRQASRA